MRHCAGIRVRTSSNGERTMDRIARNIGRGLVAGLIGTAAMTVSSTVEAKLRGRAASTVPADAARTVLGIEKFTDDTAEQRFSQLAHWGYGTGLGVLRGLLRTLGLGPRLSSILHYALVYGGEQLLLPQLAVAPPATEWGAEEVAIDAWHHLVYVTATARTFERLSRRGDERR